ncbi:MAG: hypothetical protein AAF577_10510 [Pseudomonadota bacterium]
MFEIDPSTGAGQYRALDASLVIIPALPPLPDGPMPRFGEAEMPALSQLIAFRDRAVDQDTSGQTARIEPADYASMDRAIRDMAQHAEAEQRSWRLGVTREMAKRRAISDARFGADGRGFLTALDSGEIAGDFWAALRTLMFQRIGLLSYHAPEMQGIVRDWLYRFPPRIRVPLVAQLCEPLLDHRQSDVMQALMDAFLAAPYADLRHLETGPAKPERLEDMSAELLAAMLDRAFAAQVQVARFKRLSAASQGEPQDEATMMARAREMTALLREEGVAALTPDQRALVQEFLFEQQPARRQEDGAVQSEINLHRTGAFRAAMAAIAPGKPEGHYMRAALSTRPAGFAGINLALFPTAVVWSYIATHLDMIDRALGLAEPLPVEPKFERAKAVALLRLLPKTPARYGDVLFDIATGKAQGGRADAQALLAGAGDYVTPAFHLLDTRAAGTCEQAARTLGAIGDASAATPLRTRLESKQPIRVEAAILDALAALGAWDEALAMPAHLLEAEASEGLLKPWKDAISWVASLMPPPLQFRDGTPVGPAAALWLLRLGAEIGAPTGSVSIDYRLGALDAASRMALAVWVLERWIDYDTQPWTVEHLAEAWAAYPTLSGRSYVGVRYQTVPGTAYGQKQVSEEGWPQKEDWLRTHPQELRRALASIAAWEHYPNSGHQARGLLAIARHAPTAGIAPTVRRYLEQHRRRTAQAKAMLDFAASIATAECLDVVRSVACDETASRGLRSHASALLPKSCDT